MRPHGPSAELFAAFVRINSGAFRDNRLLSCPTLSKAPNYGRVLDRWLRKEPPVRRGALYYLRTALGYAAANGGHLLFLLLGALYIRLLGWKRPPALTDARALLIIDSFALLPEIAREGRFKERYLPGLAEAAAEEGRAVVRLHRLYGSRAPITLWLALKALAGSDKAASGEARHLLEAHLFTPGDWLRLARHIFSYPFALAGLIRSLSGYADDSPEAAIREALLDSAGQCALTGEARRIAGYRLGLLSARRANGANAAHGAHGAHGAAGAGDPDAAHGLRIVSWYENQTVNKCLHRGLTEAEARTGRHVLVTGAQLFLWPATLLNNHADDEEAALKLTPDTVLVNGPWYMPDHTAQRYAVGPSLRYGHLFGPDRHGPDHYSPDRYGPDREPKARLPGPLLVLLSYHPEETRRVLELALPLALQKGGAGVVYRFHPATRPEDFADLLPPEPRFSPGPLMEAFCAAEAVLGAGSGSLAEAAALGVPVLSVTGEPGSPEEGLNYLPDIGRGVLWERVSRADEAAGALERLSAAEPGKRKEQARLLRDALFCEPTRGGICRAFEL